MTSIQQTKTTSTLLVVLACLPSPPAHAQCGQLSWIEAINQGLEANQALVAARQTLDAQQKDLAIARSTMLPDCEITDSVGPLCHLRVGDGQGDPNITSCITTCATDHTARMRHGRAGS